MIGGNIFFVLFISNLKIKFLKKKDPTNESGLVIFLKHEISKRRMISEDGSFDPSRYGKKSFKANTIANNFFSVVV